MNSFYLHVIAITFSPAATALNLHSSYLDEIQQKYAYLTLNSSNRCYGANGGKTVLQELHKLWKRKHHTKHLKELCLRNEHTYEQINKNNPKFEIGQPVMVKNHADHTFKLKYLHSTPPITKSPLTKNQL